MSKRVNYNLINNTSGNMGVGTTSPNYKLHVIGNIFSTGSVTCMSDIRMKYNISDINLSNEKLNEIDSLKAIRFSTLDNRHDEVQIGFIAQEVEKIIPEVVYTHQDTGLKSIAYGNMTAILLEYSKSLRNQVIELQSKIEDLESKINNTQK